MAKRTLNTSGSIGILPTCMPPIKIAKTNEIKKKILRGSWTLNIKYAIIIYNPMKMNMSFPRAETDALSNSCINPSLIF
jgi:hypothetical protein